jgi:hypothetical protein
MVEDSMETRRKKRKSKAPHINPRVGHPESSHNYCPGHSSRRLSLGGIGIGGGEGTVEESPAVGDATDETDYFRVADKPEVIALKWG